MKKNLISVLIVLSSINIFFAQEQKNVRVFGFVQPVYTVNLSNSISPNNQFYLNRLRIGVESKFSNYAYAEVQLDPLDQFLIKDAKVELDFLEDFSLSFGRFKKPFSLERLTSVKNIPFLERSKIVKEMNDLSYAGRDLGLQVDYKTKFNKIELLISVGVFNGNPNSFTGDNNNSKSFAQRIEVNLKKSFSFGINSSQKFDSLSGKYFTANGLDFSFNPLKDLKITSEFLIGKKNSRTSIGGFYSTIEYMYDDFIFGVRFSQYYKDIKKSGTNYYQAKVDWKPKKFLQVNFNLTGEQKNSSFENNLFLGVSYEI
jgi:hypothetical protein